MEKIRIRDKHPGSATLYRVPKNGYRTVEGKIREKLLRNKTMDKAEDRGPKAFIL
jgi:hypothetical protein